MTAESRACVARAPRGEQLTAAAAGGGAAKQDCLTSGMAWAAPAGWYGASRVSRRRMSSRLRIRVAGAVGWVPSSPINPLAVTAAVAAEPVPKTIRMPDVQPGDPVTVRDRDVAVWGSPQCGTELKERRGSWSSPAWNRHRHGGRFVEAQRLALEQYVDAGGIGLGAFRSRTFVPGLDRRACGCLVETDRDRGGTR